ncbi:MAG TPA: Rieske (2Fe-2S) protein [Candidatus Acidoferrales bacterium]|nr:Rieske (2Fe-2S) protein [Candidatus Acidoferrales bacterium]
MKPNMLDYSADEIAQYSDEKLESEWRDYMAFSRQRQLLREAVQRAMRKKAPAPRVKLTDIPEGAMTTTKEGAREILLAKVAGRVYAIDNACGHSGYPLSRGKLDGYTVTCRWHNARFDVRTGEVIAPGADIKPVKRFEVTEALDGTLRAGEEI